MTTTNEKKRVTIFGAAAEELNRFPFSDAILALGTPHAQRNVAFHSVLTHVLHELEEISLHELEHKEKLVLLSNDLLQLHDVGVTQLLQGPDFSQLHTLFPAAPITKIRQTANMRRWVF